MDDSGGSVGSAGGSVSSGGVNSSGAVTQAPDVSIETSFENDNDVVEEREVVEAKTENSTKFAVNSEEAEEIMAIPGTAHDKLEHLSRDEPEEEEEATGKEYVEEIVFDNKVEDTDLTKEEVYKELLQQKALDLQSEVLWTLAKSKKEKVDSEELEKEEKKLEDMIKELRAHGLDPACELYLLEELKKIKKESLAEFLLLIALSLLDQAFDAGEKEIDENVKARSG